MVVFTCNHCGESVKKPAVEKHYNFKCRGAPKFVSCMDCQKDFNGEDYVAHIRCITEAEKYSGKDYIAKEPKNSGQKKQENWMDIIRSILDTKEYNLSNQARVTFQKLQNVDNVPRKKAKFQNFVANCMRMRKDQAEEVWSILEKELEKIKANKVMASQVNVEAKEPANIEIHKRDRPQIKLEMQAEIKPEIEPEIKPDVKLEVEPEIKPEKDAEEQREIIRVKKSKSKKRKVDKQIQNTIEQDEANEILEMISDMVGKDQVGAVSSGEPSKKKSKKRETTVGKQEELNAEQEPTITTTTPDEFQWALIMMCILRKYGNIMKVDKLKRKMQRLYLCKREMTAFTERQLLRFDKKFAKYIKKCNLKVESNVISPIH